MADLTGERIAHLKQQISRFSNEFSLDLQKALDELVRLRALINTPQTDDFFAATRTEAAHQQERWGVKHDLGKTPADWFWLLGYLSGKALASFIGGDQAKGLHHIISTTAALLNWYRHVTGENMLMQPGHGGTAAALENDHG